MADRRRLDRRLIGFAVLVATDAALAASGRRRARLATKPALMPLLMPGRDGPTRTALGLAWVGDIALLGRGDAAFLTGLSAFLAGHLSWLRAMRRRDDGRPPALTPRARAAARLGYVGLGLTLNAVLWRRTGSMRLPVVGYSAVLLGVGLATLGSPDRATSAGGALFVASDALLALEEFTEIRLPGHDGLVMVTYAAAQALLAHGGAAKPLAH